MSIIRENWRGLAMIGLGAGTLLATGFLLETCADAGHFVTMPNGMQMHMGCTWTERAVNGMGMLLIAMGLVSLIMRKAARAVSLTASSVGLLMLVTPVWLIPTCKNPNMPCNLSLKPGIFLIGGLVLLTGLAGTARFRRAQTDTGIQLTRSGRRA